MTGILLNELSPAIEVFRNANLGSTEEMRAARVTSESMNAALSILESTIVRLAQNNDDVAKSLDLYTLNAAGARNMTLEQTLAVVDLVEALQRQRDGLPTDAEMGAWERGLKNAAAASNEAAYEENNLARALGWTNQELLDQIRNLRGKLDEQLALIDPVYAAIRAEQEYAKAQAEVNRLEAEGKETTEDYINALFEQEIAFLRMQGMLKESGVVIDRFVEHLNEMIADGRLTEAQVQAIIDRLGEQGRAMDLIDGKVVTTTHVHRQVFEAAAYDWAAEGGGSRPAQFRARGGPISAGQPYIVGEEGPELIIPSAAGRVMSAPQTQGMLGGSTYQYVTVNMPPGADGDQVVSALRRWERSNGPIPVGVR
jgi:hypothetical protein